MRLAHFSDLHFTDMPLAEGFALKRLGALGSYIGHRRILRFAKVEEQVKALLLDFGEVAPDHILCTGDLTGVGSEREFAQAKEALAPLLATPQRFTCLVGNHDVYTPPTVGRFERVFGAASLPRAPVEAKDLADNVTVVGVRSCRPTRLFDSSGRIGKAALKSLRALLHEERLKERFVIVALHYGLMRHDGTPDSPSHGLRDAAELLAVLDEPSASVDLVVHGHLHKPFIARTARHWVVNAGSTTDLAVPCGYFVLDIDAGERKVRLLRRVWRDGGYVGVPEDALSCTMHTRALLHAR